MKRKGFKPQIRLVAKRFSAISDLKTRLTHLDWLDVVVLTAFAIIVVGTFYVQSLRHS